MSTLARISAFSAALLFAAAGAARADSFMTSIGYGSVKAAKIGPAPYTNGKLTAQQSKTIVKRALKLTRGRDLGAAMDAVRMVDSAAEDPAHAGLAVDFKAGLQAAVRRGTNRERFLDGYAIMVRDPSNDAATELVRQAAREARNDSAIQLGAFQAIAQRAWNDAAVQRDTASLWREAAGYLKRAQELELAKPHAEVETGLKQALAYAKDYPDLKALLQ
jgi:hypothetical protein